MKTSHIIRLGNALDMSSIPDSSIDLIVTSPPYFGQRIYFDDKGNEIKEAVGSEATPQEYLDALDTFMEEAWRVIKPTGSVFVNLGDKYAGSGGHNNASIQGMKYDPETPTRDGPTHYTKVTEVRRKSLIGLPWRFALSQMAAGWVLRQEMIWHKPNSMPESVTDRTKRAHEQWFHFTKEETYYSAIDLLRKPHSEISEARSKRGRSEGWAEGRHPPDSPPQHWTPESSLHVLGKLPDSVQRISTGGVRPTKEERARFNLPDHFAPFPPEWPRFFILGWSPPAWCKECGDPVRPVVEKVKMKWTPSPDREAAMSSGQFPLGEDGSTLKGTQTTPPTTTIIGFSCSCPGDFSYLMGADTPSTWTPSLILDPFAGTGTTSLVARILDRSSIALDISSAYIRLMNWRLRISNHQAKIESKWRKRGLL